MSPSPRAGATRTSAPGRVNLIGEHTDYNDGFVLPIALPNRTHVDLEPRAGGRVRVRSEGFGEAEYRLGDERPGNDWVGRVQACTAQARSEGHRVGGFDARITSSLPAGAGLGSSAALAVALLRAMRERFSLFLDDLELALLAHRAEVGFVGVRAGVMDQLASSLATEGAALFIDTRSLAMRTVPLPHAAELLVIDSGVAHDHASGEYNARRAQCEDAARALGVVSLRDARDAARLADPLARRVRHVVSENARVLAAVEALVRDDLQWLGALLVESHRSLRDDYEVSSMELDTLVDLALAETDTYGARLTGGGFGGSVIALVRRGAGADVAHRVAIGYAERTGRAATVLLPR